MNLAALDLAYVDLYHNTVLDGFPRPCGYADAPTGGGWQGDPGESAFTPYLGVWPVDADRDAILLSDPHAHLEQPWVVKAVSIDPGQARRIADDARDLTIATVPSALPGLAITWQRVSGARGPYPDHDTIPPLYVVAFTVTARLQSTQE